MRLQPAFSLLIFFTAHCSAPVTEVDRRIVNAWLVCDECTGNEQQRVVARGSKVVSYLKNAITQGPPGKYDTVAELRAIENVGRTQRYRRDNQLVTLNDTDSARSVERHRDAFDLTWRLRAAQALRAIDAAAASASVAAFCAQQPASLTRRLEFKPALNQIGTCP